MSTELQKPELRTTQLTYIRNGVANHVDLPVPAGFFDPPASDPPAPAVIEGENADADVNEIVDALKKEFYVCDTKLRDMMRPDEDGDSVLSLHDAVCEKHIADWVADKKKKNKKNPEPLFVTRVAAKFTKDMQRDGWREPTVIDLSEPENRKYFSNAMLADYRNVKPWATHVRMLVLETVVLLASGGTAMMRYCVYYMLAGKQDAEIRAFNRKEGVTPSDEKVAKALQPPRLNTETDKTVRVVHQFSDFFLFMKSENEKPDAKDKERAAASGARLEAARARYAAQREKIRGKQLEKNMPLVTRFLMAVYGTQLTKRWRDAEPGFPERIAIRVRVRKSGREVYLDDVVFVTEQEAATVTAQYAKEDAAAAKDPVSQRDIRQAYRSALRISEALKTANPSNQVVLAVCDEGVLQDTSVSIEAIFPYTVDIADIENHAAAAEEELKKAAADSSTTEE